MNWKDLAVPDATPFLLLFQTFKVMFPMSFKLETSIYTEQVTICQCPLDLMMANPLNSNYEEFSPLRNLPVPEQVTIYPLNHNMVNPLNHYSNYEEFSPPRNLPVPEQVTISPLDHTMVNPLNHYSNYEEFSPRNPADSDLLRPPEQVTTCPLDLAMVNHQYNVTNFEKEVRPPSNPPVQDITSQSARPHSRRLGRDASKAGRAQCSKEKTKILGKKLSEAQRQQAVRRRKREASILCIIPDCSVWFTTEDMMKKHIKGFHLNIRDHFCGFCPYASAYRSDRNRHEKVHDKR